MQWIKVQGAKVSIFYEPQQKHTADFYMYQRGKPLSQPDKVFYALAPGDIHQMRRFNEAG